TDDAVDVIELLVAVGDTVAKDQGLLTLESDKATMEVPASAGGRITALKVKVGDQVRAGDLIAEAESPASSPVGAASAAMPSAGTPAAEVPAGAAPAGAGKSIAAEAAPTVSASVPSSAKPSGRKPDIDCEMLVLGAGP